MAVIYQTVPELEEKAKPSISSLDSPTILDQQALQSRLIDDLVFTAEFAEDDDVRNMASTTISQLANVLGATSTSIYPLYKAFGEGKIDGFTVPSLNVRTLTYDLAQTVFRLMTKYEIGAVVFELSRGEIEYTHQRPHEYLTALLAAAIKVNYQGPIFVLGDHYQFSQKKFVEDREKEIGELKQLIQESLAAGYGNIDIDASTLVDLTQTDLKDQQKLNSDMTALLTNYIREIEPKGQTISIGGEIGHIGDRNSTVGDFEAFMELYLRQIHGIGISKVSVQTGTSHGGTPLPDGELKPVTVDFSVLNRISTLAREKYHIGGAVQHGASTLPDTDFDHFVENKTLEVHLATGLQNIVYDHMPTDLRNEMYQWINENLASERKADWNDEQFLYKTRKKALGPFKEVLWSMTPDEKQRILTPLEEHLTTIFSKLKTFHTKAKVAKFFS